MSKVYRDHLKRLHEEVWFQKFIETELLPATPTVPSYNPSADNTERWKYDSAAREGYLMCLEKLGVKNG